MSGLFGDEGMRNGQQQRRQRLDSDPRTPMAWQHRDNYMRLVISINFINHVYTFDSPMTLLFIANQKYFLIRGDPYAVEAPKRGNVDNGGRNNGVYGGRSTPVGNSSRYGGPPTPSSAHSRTSRTPDYNRDARGSSSDR